jgi:uncharacterized protein
VPARNVYLDANVFVEMWENKQTDAGRLIWRLFAVGIERDWRFVSSELSLAEALVEPIAAAKRTNDWSLVHLYRFQIFDKDPFQTIAPVTRDVLDMAANVRSENVTIKLPDAIHLATALLEKCSHFVTNDHRFAHALKRDLHPKTFSMVVTFSEISDLIESA